MSTPTTNLYMEQGSDFTRNIILEQCINGVDTPIDLTGFTAAAQMRRSYFSKTAVDFDVTIVDAVNGTIQLSLANSETRLLRPTRYVYDVYITSLGGIRDRVLQGTVIVTPGVTQ